MHFQPAATTSALTDWLAVLIMLLVGGFLLLAGLLIWLGRTIGAQFRRHDAELRAEIVQVNRHFEKLIRITRQNGTNNE